MADPFASKDGNVDVAAVMEALRERIQRRADAAPLQEEVARRLRGLADSDQLDPELLESFLAGDARWNLAADYKIVTHRHGLAASMVVGAKRLLRLFIRSYTDPIVERQAQINQYLLHVIETLLEETTRLRREASKPKSDEI